jgi:predicted patatin/cPLA2 family phospholipase
MRGVVSAGMTTALEQLGLRTSFDEVYGASAGAFNAAFFLSGQAGYLTSLYGAGFGDPRFVSVMRALRGGPAFDMDFVVSYVWTRWRRLNTQRILDGGIELHCTATDLEQAEIVDLGDLTDAEQIRCALRASARLPWLAGPPVSFRGRQLLDATLAEAIPVHAALRRATHVLVLQTRPHGIAHTPLSPVVGTLTDRYLRGLNPELVRLRQTRSQRYDELSERLGSLAADPLASPSVCVIRPPAQAVAIGQLESRTPILQRAGAEGMRAAWMALNGEDPELLATLRAYTTADGSAEEPAPPLHAGASADSA